MSISACCGHVARETSEHALQGWFWGMQTPLVHVAWAPSSPHAVAPATPCSILLGDGPHGEPVHTPSVLTLSWQPGQCLFRRAWGKTGLGLAPCRTLASPALPTGNKDCSLGILDCRCGPIPWLEKNRSPLRWGEQCRGGQGSCSGAGGGPAFGGEGCRVGPSALPGCNGTGAESRQCPLLALPRGSARRHGGVWPHWDFYGNPGTERGGIAQTICSSPTYKLGKGSVFRDDITTNALLLFITQPSVMVSSCAKHASGC